MTGKTVKSLKTSATGTVREEHPKAFSKILLRVTVESPDAEESDVAKALAVSEAKLCPVWAMLRGNVEVETAYTIVR
jgi:putative redox protein